MHPSGRYAYVAYVSGVYQFTIGADGSLAPMTPSIVTTGTFPRSVTVDPSGRYAYVANFGSANVSQYTIGADGSLTAITAAIVAGTNPTFVHGGSLGPVRLRGE